MGVINVAGTQVSQASYKKARSIAANKDENRSKQSVLASIRQMMPGWNVSTNPAELRGNGMRNLEIAPDVLERMAEDPEELVRFKAIILDLEDVVQELEEHVAENPSLAEMVLQIIIDADGNMTARGTARTQDGVQRSREFDLSDRDLPSWAELMRKHLEDLRERNSEEDGTSNWYG